MKLNLKYKDQELDFDKRAIPALIFFFVLLTIGIIIFFSWRSQRKNVTFETEDKVTIATTIFPLYDMVRNIVDQSDNFDIVQLIPSGTNPHTFELSVQDKEIISKADVAFIVGAGFDDWVKDSIDDDSKLIDLSNYIDLYAYEDVSVDTKTAEKIVQFGSSCMKYEGTWLSIYNECENISKKQCTKMEGDFNECASSCRNIDKENISCIQVCVPVCTYILESNSKKNSQEKDPHYWLSVENAKKMVTEMYNTIMPLSKGDSRKLYNNTTKYLSILDEAKKYIQSRKDTSQENYLITYHNSFGYFAREYGFTIVGTFEDSEGQEPSAKHLAELTDIIKKYKISVLYQEPQMNPEILSSFAQDNNLSVRTLDPLGGDEKTASYVDLLYFNIHAITEGET